MKVFYYIGAFALVAVLAIDGLAAERQGKNAKKVIDTLKILNLDYQPLTDTIEYIDINTKDSYFTISEVNMLGLDASIGYQTNGIDMDNLQLRISSPNENYKIIANHSGVMLHYKLEL